MGRFAIDYFLRMARSWYSYVNFAFLVIALIASITGQEIVVPTWGWWLAAVFAVYISGFFVEWRFHQQKARPIEPDTRLANLLKRILGREDIFGNESGDSTKLVAALYTLREKALHGNVIVFGVPVSEWRSSKPADWPLLVRHKIPADHWSDHQIDFLGLLGDPEGEIVPISGPVGREQATYRDLWLSSAQVDEMWPAPRRPARLFGDIALAVPQRGA